MVRHDLTHMVRQESTHVTKYDLTHVARYDPGHVVRYDLTHIAKHDLAQVAKYNPTHEVVYEPFQMVRYNPTHIVRHDPTHVLNETWGQVPHYRHLASHILHVHRRPQLPLRDRLAREELVGVAVHAEVGDAELPTAELPVEHVLLLDPAHRLGVAAQHHHPLGVATAPVVVVVVVLAGRAAVVVVGYGEVGIDILPGHGLRRQAAVAHPNLRSDLFPPRKRSNTAKIARWGVSPMRECREELRGLDSERQSKGEEDKKREGKKA
ncbi:hypothetical protein B296_00006202 [Ensete ventricosum]|uniref:Uncharacterized protein n=1 Tax=Ensete ventricosum TaxID=4639 RepID=A0A427B8D5_ENSVE|nr:hypothetical protein B296_00006202 [Ensete ventricosum]